MLESYLDCIEAPFSDEELLDASFNPATCLTPSNHTKVKVRAVVISFKPSCCAVSHLLQNSTQSCRLNLGTLFVFGEVGFITLDKVARIDPASFFSDYALIIILHSCQGPAGDIRCISSAMVEGCDQLKPVESVLDGAVAEILTNAIVNRDAPCIVLVNEHQSIRCELEGILYLWNALDRILRLSDSDEIPDSINRDFRKAVPLNRKVPLYT